jgi:hypothetical protein
LFAQLATRVLKTSINEYLLAWPEILAKAKALEQAEVAIAELAPAKEIKHDCKEKVKFL